MAVYLDSSIADGGRALLQGSELRSFPIPEKTDCIETRNRYGVRTSSVDSVLRTLGTTDATLGILVYTAIEGRVGNLWYVIEDWIKLPATDVTRKELTAFTFPGASKTTGVTSRRTFNRYGTRQPISRTYPCDVTISYTNGEPVSIPTPTIITAPEMGIVDFVGSVYDEDTLEFLGFTNPPVLPNPYIIAVDVGPWRGPIYQTKVTSVDPSLFL